VGAYESMKDRLSPTGLYLLNGSSGVDAELMAYAAGLDPLIDSVKELQRESFFATAESWGLSSFEVASGMKNPPADLAEARKRLAALTSVCGDDCSADAILSLLTSLGFSLTLAPGSTAGSLVCSVTKVPEGTDAELLQELQEFFPAHLDVSVTLPG
jgi:hypothetical protein